MRILDRVGLSEKGLRVSKSNLYRLLEAGELPPPIKIGRRSYWSEAEIDAYIADKLAQRNPQNVATLSRISDAPILLLL